MHYKHRVSGSLIHELLSTIPFSPSFRQLSRPSRPLAPSPLR